MATEDKEKPKKSATKSLMTKEEPESKTEKKTEKKKGDKKSEKKEGKKHGFSNTHIEHHDNGSHTVRHTPDDGGKEVSYAAPDMSGVHAGLDTNLGGMVGASAPPSQAPPAQATPPPAASGAGQGV